MISQLDRFDHDKTWRSRVIDDASSTTGLSVTRLDNYYSTEVWNRLDTDAERGLDLYLDLVCGVNEGAEWVKMD